MYGENTLDVYQTSYQEGGYAINANIVTENDGHFLLDPATVANNVRITNFTYNYNPITTAEVWVEHPNFYTTDGTNPNVPITNYVFSVNGYVVPKVSGNYTFDLGFTDDVSFFSIGDGHTMFGCCQPPNQIFGVNSSEAVKTVIYESIDILELDPYKYTISTRYSDYTGLVNNNISTISTTVGSAISIIYVVETP